MVLVFALVAAVGFNTNLPSDTPFTLQPMLDNDDPIQVYGPSGISAAECYSVGLNISNQLPQALVEANGGEHFCRWNVKRIIESVLPDMPGAGVIRQHIRTKETCPLNQYCPPSPCTFMEMDYQNYCPDGCADGQTLFNTLLGTTNCGPVFGRGGISGRFVIKSDFDVVQGKDDVFFPGHVKALATTGDDDILGVSPKSNLISAHPRYVDVPVPAWTHIDGLGATGTVDYDFILMASTRAPTKGPFCAEFIESGALAVAYDNRTRLNITFQTDVFPVEHTIMQQQQQNCQTECRIRSSEELELKEYIFVRETTSPGYQCTCWASNDCTRVATADGSWSTGSSVGTTFVRANSQPIVANGRLSNNLPIRKIGDRDRTSAFRCQSGVVWDVETIGANMTTCAPHGYEDHLLTCACFHYMLYRKHAWEPPDFTCCTWQTSPFIRTGVGFGTFKRERFVQNRINKTSDAALLNNIFADEDTTSWDLFWAQADAIGCYAKNCAGGRDPVTVLMGYQDRLAPCCPWFAWDDVQKCINSEECNYGGLNVGCTMTAFDVFESSVLVTNFGEKCQGQSQQRQPHVFSQFAKGSKSDFGSSDITKTVDFGHLVQILTTDNEIIEGLTDFKEHGNFSFRRAMPFVALNPGSSAQSQTGEPDAESSLFVAFSRDNDVVSVDALIRGSPALLRTWSVLQTRLSAADPCWQKSQPATMTLTFDKNYLGSIKAITVKIDQPCTGDIETGCDESQVEWDVGTKAYTHFVTVSSTHESIEALPEEDVQIPALHCPTDDDKGTAACNTSWVPGAPSTYIGNPTEWWNRYAATTGVYFDSNTQQWAIPHPSSNSTQKFCRWHYQEPLRNKGGWQDPPFPHTLPCTKKCRPLTYTKVRTHTCGESKSSMQMDFKTSRDGEEVQLYHFTRPTIGMQNKDRYVPSSYFFHNPKQVNIPYVPKEVLNVNDPAVDISKEICTVDFKSKEKEVSNKEKVDVAYNAVRQVSCKGDRTQRFNEIKFNDPCDSSLWVDFKRAQAWEGWSVAENTCLFETPYKDMCYFDHYEASQYVLREIAGDPNYVEERGFSPYDKFCKPKANTDGTNKPKLPLSRTCTMSVWTHEVAEHTNFYQENACIQEADGSEYTSNDPLNDRHNLYTPGLILGETYKYLGPKPRARARPDLWAQGDHFINPAWEFYNHNSNETGGFPDACHEGQAPFVALWCDDPYVCDEADQSQYHSSCASTLSSKVTTQFFDNRKIANCYTDNLDPSRPNVGPVVNPRRTMGSDGKKKNPCYTCYASDSKWPNYPSGQTGPMFVNTVGNMQVPFWNKREDMVTMQSETFINSLYACRCEFPSYDSDYMATKWQGATMPLNALSRFNNKPVLYIKCCATDSTWRNQQPNFRTSDGTRNGDWARTETPEFRWVNYFDGWRPGTAINEAQCGQISPDIVDSPNYMPTYDNKLRKMQRPKLDIVSPKGFTQTPEGPQQFVVTGVHLSVCASNKPAEQDAAAAGGNLDPSVRGPPLADVSHTTTDERFVPKDYTGRPYFVSEPNDPQPQMCTCGGQSPVYACERYTADAETNVLPKCIGEAPNDDSFDCVVCGWTWPTAIPGQSFPLGLFLGSNRGVNIKAIERDPLGDIKTRQADFLKFFMRAGAPVQDDLITLISNIGNWGSDFDTTHLTEQFGAVSPNNKVHVVTYPGTCLRPPYGRAHRNTLTDEDRERYFHYNDLPKSYFNGGLSYLADETLYTYCEQFRGEYTHCERDPLGADRESFCLLHASTVNQLNFGHTLLRRERACNPTTKLCLFIDGDPDYLTFQKMNIPAGALVLISPIHWNVLSVLQCGNSIAKLVETGYSMSDHQAQHLRADAFPCRALMDYISLESVLNVTNALAQIKTELKTFETLRECDDGERSGPSSVAGVRNGDTNPGQCFPERFFGPTITTRLNTIEEPNVRVLTLDGTAIIVPPPSQKYGMCPVFIVGNEKFQIEQTLAVDNTGCDSGFGGAAIHFEGKSAADSRVSIKLESKHMAVAAIGMDEIGGSLSRIELDITGMQVKLAGDLSAPFVAAISRVKGKAQNTIECDSACTILLYESKRNSVDLQGNFTSKNVRVVNVSSVFGQYALAPLIAQNNHWAGKMREITVIFFLIVLIFVVALLLSIANKVKGDGLDLKTLPGVTHTHQHTHIKSAPTEKKEQ